MLGGRLPPAAGLVAAALLASTGQGTEPHAEPHEGPHEANVVVKALLTEVERPAFVHPAASEYDPASTVDPFDTLAENVNRWLLDPRANGISHKDDDWQSKFCNCMENGYISSWYQYAPALYVLDTCSKNEGFVIRTGHLQDRHNEPLQAAMSCDMLKLMSYCFMHTCYECLEPWSKYCDAAHYTVEACDADCNSAYGHGISKLALFGALVLAFNALLA
mmetsp:Transcript_113230/g.320484  ORF Transcript_113230/g.320484 Transcript_113230/m.320484 type:complete len:219 (-) Transcript_113230:72-728(-)